MSAQSRRAGDASKIAPAKDCDLRAGNRPDRNLIDLFASKDPQIVRGGPRFTFLENARTGNGIALTLAEVR